MKKSRPPRYFNVSAIEDLKAPLKRFLKKSGVGWMMSHREIVDTWNNTVGEEISDQTKVCAFRNGTLFIDVTSSTLCSELEQFYKNSLVKSINTAEPELNLRKIKFRLADFESGEKKESKE